MQMLRVAKDKNMFLYAPAIQRMMERAYTGSVSPVLPPVSPFISPSQSGVSNLHLSFSGGGPPCPLDTFLVFLLYLTRK